jgi:hypothetical protein
LSEQGAGYETARGVHGETRSFRELDRVRLTWQPPDWSHDTTLQPTVRYVGVGRAILVFHQERLADASEREQQRRHWQGVITARAAALAQVSATDRNPGRAPGGLELACAAARALSPT